MRRQAAYSILKAQTDFYMPTCMPTDPTYSYTHGCFIVFASAHASSSCARVKHS